MKVFGIDLIRGSVRSKTKKPVFALVVRENSEIVSESEITFFSLLKKIRSEKPDILGVDSLQEISVNQRDLTNLMQEYLQDTKLVAVTMIPRESSGSGDSGEDCAVEAHSGMPAMISLQKMAARYNIRAGDRLDPYSEAKAAAHLAELGAGCEVSVFGDSCEITVSRNRSLGRGGWSQNRYARKVHGAVLVRSREIEMELRESGFSFTKKEFRGFGGSRRAVFSVAAKKSAVHISESSYSDCQVKIRAEKLDRIKYTAQTLKKKHLIIGIDPGTTVGIAALDMHGGLAALKSSRRLSLSDWTEEITRIGIPVVIATDVSEMPGSVEKIRRAFNAVPFTPRDEKTQDEKAAVCTAAGFSFANDHERDSLYAALLAYRIYRQRFGVIEKRIPQGYDLDYVRSEIIKGRTPEQIIAAYGGAKKTSGRTAESASDDGTEPDTSLFSASDARTVQLEGIIKSLRAHNLELTKELAAVRRELKDSNKKLIREKKESTEERRLNTDIAVRDSQIESLKKMLKKKEKDNTRLLKRIAKLKLFTDPSDETGTLPVKVLSVFTKEALKDMDDELGIREGDLIYIAKTSGWGNAAVSYLSDSQVGGVIADSSDSRLITALRLEGIPFLSVSEVPVTVRGRTGRVLQEAHDAELSKWSEEQAVFEKERRLNMIVSIVDDYKKQRVVEARSAEKVRDMENQKRYRMYELTGGDDDE